MVEHRTGGARDQPEVQGALRNYNSASRRMLFLSLAGFTALILVLVVTGWSLPGWDAVDLDPAQRTSWV